MKIEAGSITCLGFWRAHISLIKNNRQKAPPVDVAKIHVDAGLLRPAGGGAAAAVCRDDHGAFLESSALVVQGVLDPATLEAIACRENCILLGRRPEHSADADCI